jgi:hypothetical protein
MNAAPLMTLVASDSSLRPIDAWEGSPLLVRDLRLAVCTVPKTATSRIKRLLLRAMGSPLWDSNNSASIHHPKTSGMPTLRAPVGGNASSTAAAVRAANELLRDPSWTRLVIVRDPVRRFMSAFLDKCARESPNWNCPVQGEDARWSVEAVLAAVEATALAPHPRESDLNDAFASSIGAVHSLNSHFLPTALFCDLRLTRRAWRALPMQPDFAGAFAAAVGGLHVVNGARPGLLEDVQGWARVMLTESLAPQYATPSDALVRVLRAAAAAAARSGAAGSANALDAAVISDGRSAAHGHAQIAFSRILHNVTGAGAIDILRRIECFYAIDYQLFADVLAPPQWCHSHSPL